jgi:hypothetical protein
MKKLRIYLDTSVVNFLFAEDAPDFRRVTEDFFTRHAQKYELFASEVVLLEILRDPNPPHRQKLLNALRRHPITMLSSDPEIERMADVYLARGVIPARKREDVLSRMLIGEKKFLDAKAGLITTLAYRRR